MLKTLLIVILGRDKDLNLGERSMLLKRGTMVDEKIATNGWKCTRHNNTGRTCTNYSVPREL